MPAHVVCDVCGWREPVMAATPKGTRTWDSSRDEARYQREKMRRDAVEAQRHQVTARRAAPERLPARRLSGTIVALKRAVGE